MTISFNVQHAPRGAWSSFTIGHFGTRGGPGGQRGRPGNSNVFIGVEREGEAPTFLPFFQRASDRALEFGVSAGDDGTLSLRTWDEGSIRRELRWTSDVWTAGPLKFSLVSPFWRLPDPASASDAELRLACCPVVFATLQVDNRSSDRSCRAMLAIDDHKMRDLASTSQDALVGVACGTRHGLAARPRANLRAFIEHGPVEGFRFADERLFRIGRTGGLVLTVGPRATGEVVVAIGFHEAGLVTTGFPARYFYNRYFENLEAVLAFGLDHWEEYRARAAERNAELAASTLNEEQRFLLAHATHSYWGSTALLERADHRTPLWVVYEGEYEMMNTLDLTVDQAFFEMRYLPWAVRNELDFFVERYSYIDRIRRPDDPPDESFEGGIAFCHDQGVGGQFTPPGESSYELANVPARCFSYMAYEELANWICCAGVYVAGSGDDAFLRRHESVVMACFDSLTRRDDPDPTRRTGMMGLEGARTRSGAEITTYDSLDPSLGPARGNLYLGVKTWACHVILEWLFRRLDRSTEASLARDAARLSAATIAAAYDPALGYLPANLAGGSHSAIVPAIEGLVYPHVMGIEAALDFQGDYGALLDALRRHFIAVFRPGICQFEGGGWKLSSSSDNSWMSKIAICQYVAKAVLGIEPGEDALVHDRAHADWQRSGTGAWACCDQMANGVAIGSRFYPRLVTACLWLEED